MFSSRTTLFGAASLALLICTLISGVKDYKDYADLILGGKLNDAFEGIDKALYELERLVTE